MSQPHLHAPAGTIGRQQALTIRCGQDLRLRQSFQQLRADRFCEGDEFQQLQHRGMHAAEASFDQLHQARAGDDRTVPAPHPRDARQVAAVQPTQNQLPKVERITLGKPPQGLHRASVHLPAERRAGQGLDIGVRECLNLEPVRNRVLPQGDDRVGGVRLTADGDEDRDGRGCGELVHQGRGRVIQKVGIADADQKVAIARRRDESVNGTSEQRRPVRGGIAKAWQQMRDGAERDQ